MTRHIRLAWTCTGKDCDRRVFTAEDRRPTCPDHPEKLMTRQANLPYLGKPVDER